MKYQLLSQGVRQLCRRQFVYGLIAAVLIAQIAGCTSGAFVGLGYLIGGPPSITPEFDKLLKFSLKGSDKLIAVVCYAPKELKFDVDDVDAQLARTVSYRLQNHEIDVIRPEVVQNWLDRNDDWHSPAEIGEELDAGYVIYIDMHEYSLYEKDSTNLYRGRTTAKIQVFDLTDSDGEIIFEHELVTQYPLRQPASTDEIPRQRFKNLYMSFLSEKIGQLFYERYAGSDIPNGVLN